MREQYFKLEKIKNCLILTHSYHGEVGDEEAFKWDELEKLFKKMFLILSINRRAHIKIDN